MSPLLKQVTGDCDCCDSVNIVITMRHDMKMCDDCIAKEDAVVPTIQSVDALIQQSRKMDDAIQLKQDVFNATSVAAIEIHAAIMNDPSIPDDQKDFMVVKELFRRQQHLQEVLFNERQSILQHESEMRAWQVQTQEFAGKLRAELRAQFKVVDINYQPVTPKSPKTAKAPKPSTGRTRPNTKEVTEAAAKYGVVASMVAMVCDTRKLSPEAAAKFLAEKLNQK
jgi:hypothetical protein